MNRNLKFLSGIFVLLVLSGCGHLSRNKMRPEDISLVFSENKEYRLAVLPPLGIAHEEQAKARIYKKKAEGRYEMTSEQTLVNSLSPVWTFIADSGAFVTIGDLHSASYDNGVALYSGGHLAKSYALNELLAPAEMIRYARKRARNESWVYGPRRRMTDREYSVYQERIGFLGRWGRRILLLRRPKKIDQPEFKFSDDQTEFILTTGWGKSLRFNLESGELLK